MKPLKKICVGLLIIFLQQVSVAQSDFTTQVGRERNVPGQTLLQNAIFAIRNNPYQSINFKTNNGIIFFNRQIKKRPANNLVSRLFRSNLKLSFRISKTMQLNISYL